MHHKPAHPYMGYLLIAVCLVAFCAAPTLGNYIESRQAAMKLMRQGRQAEAIKAFREMAAGDVSRIQQADALEQAVVGYIKLKQYDKARQLAQDVPIESVATYCEMRILAAQGESQAIVDRFGEVDIQTWPMIWRPHGYELRGTAAWSADAAELAIADLKQAIKYSSGLTNPKQAKPLLLLRLGRTYQNQLDDIDKAIDAYRRCQRTGNRFKGSTATFLIANILVEQGKPNEAIREVERWIETINLDQWSNSHGPPYVLSSYAAMLAKIGKTQQAIARYEQALAREDIPEHDRQSIEQKLQNLKSERKSANSDGDDR